MLIKQECIPVGCVPPTAVAIPGGLHHAPPRSRHPSPQSRHPPGSRNPQTRHPPSRHPPRSRHPLGADTPLGADPPGTDIPPPPWTESQMPCSNFVAGGNNCVPSVLALNLPEGNRSINPFELSNNQILTLTIPKLDNTPFIWYIYRFSSN